MAYDVMPTDEQRGTHMVSGPHNTLTPEGAFAFSPLPTHTPSDGQLSVFGLQLIRGPLCRIGKGEHGSREILEKFLFLKVNCLSTDRTKI